MLLNIRLVHGVQERIEQGYLVFLRAFIRLQENAELNEPLLQLRAQAKVVVLMIGVRIGEECDHAGEECSKGWSMGTTLLVMQREIIRPIGIFVLILR